MSALVLLSATANANNPNWAEKLLGISSAIAAIGVFYAAIQVFDSRKARRAAVAAELAAAWAKPAMEKARRLVNSHATTDDLKAAVLAAKSDAVVNSRRSEWSAYTRYLNFFEQIGLEFHSHRLSLRVVDRALGNTIIHAWETWRQVIPEVWGPDTQVGAEFQILALKL